MTGYTVPESRGHSWRSSSCRGSPLWIVDVVCVTLPLTVKYTPLLITYIILDKYGTRYSTNLECLTKHIRTSQRYKVLCTMTE